MSKLKNCRASQRHKEILSTSVENVGSDYCSPVISLQYLPVENVRQCQSVDKADVWDTLYRISQKNMEGASHRREGT